MYIKSGTQFGRLSVAGTAESRVHGNAVAAYSKVVCDCGARREVRNSCLRDGTTKSCGCARRAAAGKSTVGALLSNYKYGARIRKLAWRLNRQQFEKIVKQNCYYCGDAPRFLSVGKKRPLPIPLNGVDRITPVYGYSVQNVVPCCTRCNRMKSCLSQKEFIQAIRKINLNLKGELPCQ
jgi:hypothetical protein